MPKLYTEGKTFNGVDFTAQALPIGNYEGCTFVNCNFSNTNLSDVYFIECKLEQCNVSVATIANTAFRDITFKNCKLLGLHFENANAILFEVQFEACQLNLSSFYQRSLKNTQFKNCSLQEVDFVEADLTNAVFHNCDLSYAIYENTILEKADFRTAYHYSINPELNRIKKAKFSMAGIIGLLDKYDIEVE